MTAAFGDLFASSTFWGPAVGVIAVVVMGAFGAWVAWRTANPKRRLEYSLRSTPLLAGHSLGSAKPGSVIVTYEDMPLTDPHVFTLEVRSLGGRDIRSSDFDSNRPLRFNVGSELKAWLDIKAKTGAVAGYSQKIELSPCLIRKGNVFKVIALTEGRASVFCDNPLVDIQVTEHAVPNSVLRVGILNASWQGALILAAAWFIPAVLTYLELVAVRRSALAMALFYGLYVVYPIVLYAAINRLLRIFERRDGDAADDW